MAFRLFYQRCSSSRKLLIPYSVCGGFVVIVMLICVFLSFSFSAAALSLVFGFHF